MWCAGKDCAEGSGNLKDLGELLDITAVPLYPEPTWLRVGEAELAMTFVELPKRLVEGCAPAAAAARAAASVGVITTLPGGPFGHRLLAGEVE
mmetsp:Transcript_55324/g.148205  ORF Transcript_55324/g.148205 Transcript_55324/m.148205 type:complete len:93 (-) Transcript_55324:477-755(-)